MAQNGQFDVRFSVHEVDLANMKFYLDIEIRAEEANTGFSISEQNYRFDYSIDVLANPVITEELVLSGLVATSNPSTSSLYMPHTLQGSLPGLISYNIELAFGEGYPLGHVNYVGVGRIAFDILDLDKTVSLVWHDYDDMPISFVGEKYNDTLSVADEGSYGDYIQDLSVLLQANQVPLPVNDFASVEPGLISTIDILANDQDNESSLDSTSVVLLSTPPASQGSVSVDTEDGSILFSPTPGFSGNVTVFQYIVCDYGIGIPSTVGEQNPIAPSIPVPLDLALQVSPPLCNSASVSIDVQMPASPRFRIRAFLEGPYQAGETMNAQLHASNILPLEQPYSLAPWNYPGTEATINFPTETVDWVLVTLRYGLDHSTTIAQTAAFLGKDGWITDVTGDMLQFDSNFASYDSLYIAIYHRNHVGIMSAGKVSVNGGLVVYDFTNGLEKNYEGLTGTVQVEPGVYGMIGGDFNGNGQVQNTDYNFMVPNIGLSGYRPSDFDLNGQVQNVDVQELIFPNLGRGANFSY